MLNNIKLILISICLLPLVFLAQVKSEKEKFVSDKTLHFKVGTNVNFANKSLVKTLNTSEMNVFTLKNNANFNPCIDIEFDYKFSKHFGLNLDLGFMQTRFNYHYEYTQIVQNYNSNPTTYIYQQDGTIISNIPHINFSPSFYISNTRFNVGFGLYKYYYTFNPLSAGYFLFDLNSEDMFIYSQIGITQSFAIKNLNLTASVNYFGLTKKFDQGLQIALGIAL